jgi:hypothetical protein
MLVTTNVCMPEEDGFAVEEAELVVPAVELVALVAELFSSTPVTRTRWLTYWLRFTLDPCGRSMYPDVAALPVLDPLAALSAVLPEVLVPV